MKLFSAIFRELAGKNKLIKTDAKSNYIFYKIVDSLSTKKYVLQCINTNAIFHLSIADIVFDLDILHGLHPIQACYVGIEYAKCLKQIHVDLKSRNNHPLNQYAIYRYGNYHLCYQNRKGDLCFVDKNTREEFVMDPRDIALSEELIDEFDAAQAFYIGLIAGLKMNNTTTKISKEYRRPLLRIIK